jgi:hypothetical protein
MKAALRGRFFLGVAPMVVSACLSLPGLETFAP